MKEKYCAACLEESKGERRTELVWLGPLQDVHACPECDLIGGSDDTAAG
jgi:hypothetical protein